MNIFEIPLPELASDPDWADHKRLETECNREIIGGPEWDVDPEADLVSARAEKEWATRWFLARDAEVAVGWARTARNMVDQPELAYVTLYVTPSHRGTGLGQALADTVREALVAEGVAMFQVWVTTSIVDQPLRPSSGFGGVDPGHGGVKLALANGLKLKQAERVSRYDFARPLVDPAEALAEAQGVAGAEYEVVTVEGQLPEGMLAGYAVLMERMAVDPPQGELTVVERRWDAERVRQAEAVRLLTDRIYRAVVRHLPTGDLVALSEMHVDRANPLAFVDQWDTIVLPDHRGHRLGMLVKAANLIQVRDKEPNARAILTWNAEENRHMLQVNEALGFYPVYAEGGFEASVAEAVDNGESVA
ncbi:GNAT family N-acetyltransferase [Tessaracoccus sp. MC1865]|uniref:GNAT family N-acetyltransferase n=1 Tax=Tessaracoccus sp. MC1865 TaxID=2760310 RepID=UPI001AE48D7E|nr:GNAT family N-acetyltransferase [Tessaracoccus sp. MC1865]QTO37165.1 GNAT family N-acetyltransferase [Tessaracoccus sp. MC1865]